MLASFFILILFLPAAFLPIALDVFASSNNLDEMGICLEKSEGAFPMQRYELAGIHPTKNSCEETVCLWEITKQLETCL